MINNAQNDRNTKSITSSDNEKNINTLLNSKEELAYYKEKVKSLQKINNQLKEQITNTFTNTSNNNDTSGIFFSRNEFKKLWESVIQTELIEPFDFCIKEYKLISNICQDLMLLVYEETKSIIDNKFLDILKCLNLTKTSKEKRKQLYFKMLPFFHDNYSNIFNLNEESFNSLHIKLINIIQNEYTFLSEIKILSNSSHNSLFESHLSNLLVKNIKNSTSSNINNNNCINILALLEKKIKNKHFDNLTKCFFNICIYMLLHEPVLTFNLQKFNQRKLNFYFFQKNNFINVEGFGNEKTPCVILLPPPLLRNKYPFNGIRPAVYILSEINVNVSIYKECESKEKNFNNKQNYEKEIFDNEEKINNNSNMKKDINIKNEELDIHTEGNKNYYKMVNQPIKLGNKNMNNIINNNIIDNRNNLKDNKKIDNKNYLNAECTQEYVFLNKENDNNAFLRCNHPINLNVYKTNTNNINLSYYKSKNSIPKNENNKNDFLIENNDSLKRSKTTKKNRYINNMNLNERNKNKYKGLKYNYINSESNNYIDKTINQNQLRNNKFILKSNRVINTNKITIFPNKDIFNLGKNKKHINIGSSRNSNLDKACLEEINYRINEIEIEKLNFKYNFNI